MPLPFGHHKSPESALAAGFFLGFPLPAGDCYCCPTHRPLLRHCLYQHKLHQCCTSTGSRTLGYKSVKRLIKSAIGKQNISQYCTWYSYRSKISLYLLKQAQSCLRQLTKSICILLQYMGINRISTKTLETD